MPATKALDVLLHRRVIGQITSSRSGQLTLTYDRNYAGHDGAMPLSLSLPLQIPHHKHDTLMNWLWGLLPDNELVLRQWGKQFEVSPRNPFALLAHVGRDCAGAVQFIPPGEQHDHQGSVHWLDNTEIEQHLRALRQNPASARPFEDAGQFSLAGAQAKTALFCENGRYGVPTGTRPTNVIMKPPLGSQHDGHAENEYFCLHLAQRMGLASARSTVEHFGSECAIVIRRFDRQQYKGQLIRLHQEDCCQAIGIHPANKYENEGGPGIADIMMLLNGSIAPAEDRERFMRAQLFNFLIAGTDAHAKNYSLLLGQGGAFRLAPLYDIASFLTYDDSGLRRAKLAMRISNKYIVNNILPRHWLAMANKTGYPSEKMMGEFDEMTRQLPDEASDLRRQCRNDGIDHPVLTLLVDRIADHCARQRQRIFLD